KPVPGTRGQARPVRTRVYGPGLRPAAGDPLRRVSHAGGIVAPAPLTSRSPHAGRTDEPSGPSHPGLVRAVFAEVAHDHPGHQPRYRLSGPCGDAYLG